MPKTTTKRPAGAKTDQTQQHAARRYGVGTRPNQPPMRAATPPIDPTEPLIPVAQLAQEAFGRRVARTSIWRWCTGRSGSRLPAVIAGGNQWLTTRRCWFEWMKYRTDERLRKAGVPLDVSDAELANAGLAD